MTWLRIDDGFVEHERVEPLTDKAFRLHVTAMCLCARKLTDGLVSDKDVRVSLTISGASQRQLRQLVQLGLWVQTDAGYEIRDYLDYNPTAEKVRADRKKAADRMANVRANVPPNVPPNVRPKLQRTFADPGPSRPLPIHKPPLPSNEAKDVNGKEGIEMEEELPPFETILKDMPL